MLYTTTITKSGQISIPKAVRQTLDLNLGDKVILNCTKSSLTIKRKMTDADFFAKMDSLISDQTRSLFKTHANKSVSELKSTYATTQNFKNDYKDEYDF